MKTLIISPCYINSDLLLTRHQTWLRYIDTTNIQYTKILWCDNASSDKFLDQLRHPKLSVSSFFQHLPRTATLEYPYIWRVLNQIKGLLRSYDKIIYMDTDFYPLSKKFVDFVNNTNTGWATVYSHYYGFPEAAFWVLNKDSFDLLKEFPIPDYYHYNGQVLEDLLPFTEVRKDFIGDRYGEFEDKSVRPNADYYAQWSPGCPEMKHES